MNDKQLRRTAIRALRAGIVNSAPGEMRDQLLARLEAVTSPDATTAIT